MITKVCCGCGVEKPLSEFYVKTSSSTGIFSKCKECVKSSRREYYKLHSEEVKIRVANHCSTHKPEKAIRDAKYRSTHKPERAIREKKYRQKNGEVIRKKDVNRYHMNPSKPEKKAKYYSEHSEEIKQRVSEYYKLPEGKATIIKRDHIRRSRNKNVENTLTLKQWNKILSMQGNRCVECKREFSETLPPTRDHIIPLFFGYGLTFGNTQALCRSCNSRKHIKFDLSKAMTIVFAEV